MGRKEGKRTRRRWKWYEIAKRGKHGPGSQVSWTGQLLAVKKKSIYEGQNENKGKCKFARGVLMYGRSIHVKCRKSIYGNKTYYYY